MKDRSGTGLYAACSGPQGEAQEESSNVANNAAASLMTGIFIIHTAGLRTAPIKNHE